MSYSDVPANQTPNQTPDQITDLHGEAPSGLMNTEKWGALTMAPGFTILPNVMIAYQSELGLCPIDMNILLHLSMYWWEAGRKPFPSKARIAHAIGRSPDTVRRHIRNLEQRGLMQRHARYDEHWGRKTNMYSLEGLIEAAQPYAAHMLAQQQERINNSY